MTEPTDAHRGTTSLGGADSLAAQALAGLASDFENLTPDRVLALAERYAEDAVFKDPFNEVRGRRAIARIYAHMFDQVERPVFRVLERMHEADRAFLLWEMDHGTRGADGRPAGRIRGVTHLRFDADGRVTWHRDYWDPAEELYEQVPVLGWVMRRIRRRLATPQS